MKATLIASMVTLASVSGCGGINLTCQTEQCSSFGTKGNSNTYQLCVGVTGSATYKFGGKSCAYSTTNSSEAEDCSVQVGAYCGVTGTTTDGGLVYTNSTDLSVAPCTITLSGAQTGTFNCTATTVYATGSNLGGPTLTVLDPSPLAGLAVVITRPGMPTDGTWTNTDSGAKGALTVSTGEPTWLAAAGSSADQGSYSMNIRLGGTAMVSNGDQYIANGTVSGTLLPVPMTGSSGTITLNASF